MRLFHRRSCMCTVAQEGRPLGARLQRARRVRWPRNRFKRDALGDLANLGVAGAALLVAAVIGAVIAVMVTRSQTLRPSVTAQAAATPLAVTGSSATLAARATATLEVVAA